MIQKAVLLWQRNQQKKTCTLFYMGWMGACNPHLSCKFVLFCVFKKCFYDANLNTETVNVICCLTDFYISDLYFGSILAFLYFSHYGLYIERLKQTGYWFFFPCLHKIPFTFTMLLAQKTKSQRPRPKASESYLQRRAVNTAQDRRVCDSRLFFFWRKHGELLFAGQINSSVTSKIFIWLIC